MAGLFDFLYGEGEALPYIIKGVANGLGLEEITTAIETGGLSIAHAKIGQVFNYLNTVIRPADEYIKFLQQFNYPNLARIPLSVTKLLRNFSYQGEMQGIDVSTGEIVTRNISISTNTLLTKQQAGDIMGQYATADTKSGGLGSAAIKVTSIRQNPAGLVMP